MGNFSAKLMCGRVAPQGCFNKMKVPRTTEHGLMPQFFGRGVRPLKLHVTQTSEPIEEHANSAMPRKILNDNLVISVAPSLLYKALKMMPLHCCCLPDDIFQIALCERHG